MMQQYRMLQKVKKLREDKALRALQQARAKLREADDRHETLMREVEQSAATLPARERAVYDKILGKTVDMGALDDAKDEVMQILSDHQKVVDRRDRAADRVVRAQEHLAEAQVALKRKQQEVEKIDTVTDEKQREVDIEVARQEETEIEDLFSRPRGMGLAFGEAS
jgi:multidrug resistance efflux pump